jgi:citronellol/citronellal dehydrogenase
MTAETGSAIFAPGLLRGQVALVTGGGTGLGRATAHELARCGAAVTIAGRRADVVERAAAEISEAVAIDHANELVESSPPDGMSRPDGARPPGEASGADARPCAVDSATVDVREPGEAEALVRTVLERRGRLDLLVNNAGGQYFVPAELITAKGWRAVWRLNVDGMLNMAQAAFELALGPAGRGMIVNVTLSPHHGMPGMAHSGSARATVEALTRDLALRWADAGVAVTAVAPGPFETEVLAKYPKSVRAGMAHTTPLQRLGTVAEHAWLVTLLASPLGRAFNGSTVTLDGARDNWFGPWPPPGLLDASGEVPTEERR